jgi:Est1 DNA/RNA binding domain
MRTLTLNDGSPRNKHEGLSTGGTKRAAPPPDFAEGALRPAKRNDALGASKRVLNDQLGEMPPIIDTAQSDENQFVGRSLFPLPSSPTEDQEEDDTTMLKQPETRAITQDQLVNEVKGIYAGLVMVEKKCVEIDQQQSQTKNKLSPEQWQALIALHRTLLHEHHDFFLASQHPSASPALRRLASEYAMPARMWRHGIHSFLELLRHRLPGSLDHMLAFVYLAYSMMALLMESVPSFLETWIECLGDLSRYRMAIEEADKEDREIWSGVARTWYNKAADRSPNVGRIQHHLAVLARPNIVQQLFYYSKSLVSVIPFFNARESIMLLFGPFLDEAGMTIRTHSVMEIAFVKANAILFTNGSINKYRSHMEQVVKLLDSYIARTSARFRVQGPELGSSLIAATLAFGDAKSPLLRRFHALAESMKAQMERPVELDNQKAQLNISENLKHNQAMRREYWASVNKTALDMPTSNPGVNRPAGGGVDDAPPVCGGAVRSKPYIPPVGSQHHPGVDSSPRNSTTQLARAAPSSTQDSSTKDATFSGSQETSASACQVLGKVTTVVCQRIGDKNVLPYMHLYLAFLLSLASVPGALEYVEGHVPWEKLVVFLNTLGRSGVVDAHVEGSDFPQSLSGTGRQLPEDFVMRGLVWSPYYLPAGFFEGQVVDEDERTLELPSHAAPRTERCLYIGVQLAAVRDPLSTLPTFLTNNSSVIDGSHIIHLRNSFPPLRLHGTSRAVLTHAHLD